MSEQQFGDFLYRGQAIDYPLQTSFHRTERKILHRYLNEDLPALHRATTAVTSHVFDMDNATQTGAFINLAQHHGYPTPLLDWTKSPFVASWFALNGWLHERKEKRRETVRIFALDRKAFSLLSSYQTLTLAPPHVSILEALAIENNRAIPQQGVLTLTNVQDMEAHLMLLEEQNDMKLLTAYDLPVSEIDVALNDLSLMGITRSTLFPGLESICADLRERMF